MTEPIAAVRDVVTRRFLAPARSRADYCELVRHLASTAPVGGCLVGVSDGEHWGWWGPVTDVVAHAVCGLFAAIDAHTPAAPGEWARRARRGTRHAHTGLLAIAVGAFELACWDLVGQRAGAPVWALLGTSEHRDILTYATCFDVPPNDADSMSFAHSVGEVWQIQKWRATPDADRLNALAGAAGGNRRLAVDFGGSWPIDEVRALCRALTVDLAWVEEPYPPSDMHNARPGDLPAPHAAGEHCYGPADTVILESAGVDLWQPDAVFCGGFEALRTIVARARGVGARCLPHGGGFIAAVHAAAGGADIESIEYHLLLEPARQAHLETPVLPCHGVTVPPPERPGWAGALHPHLRIEAL